MIALTRPREGKVLAAVNEIRADLGREPLNALPKGRPGQAGACPIALGIGGAIVTSQYWSLKCDNGPVHREPFSALASPVRMPRVLKRFIRHFDREHYPQLVRHYDEY